VDSRGYDSATEGVFIVVAAYNEAGAIGEVVRELRAAYPRVIVVDDGSVDDTAGAAKAAGAIVLRHGINCGQGAALQTGIEFALRRGARYVVTFDADGQHSVEDVATLLAPILAGECEITLGSRFLGQTVNMPRRRRWMLRLGVAFTRVVSGLRVTDTHNGLRAFSRAAAGRIDLRMDRMAHASEILDQIRRGGLPWREVPTTIRYTDYSLRKGQSMLGAFKILLHYVMGRVSP